MPHPKLDYLLLVIAGVAQAVGSTMTDIPWGFLAVNLGALLIVGFVVYRTYVVESPAQRELVAQHLQSVLGMAAEHKSDILRLEAEHRGEVRSLIESFQQELRTQRSSFLAQISDFEGKSQR